jgi:uncharacterized membrane protein
MSRLLKTGLWLFWALAAAWPWTGMPWRAFSIPSGVLLILFSAVLALTPAGRRAAQDSAQGFEALDPQRLSWRLAALFFLWLASLKLCQYAAFQSHYGDLGQDANICWNTWHGRPFFDSMTQTSFLGDHFEPVLALCAPALRLWPSAAALLLIQCLALASALIPLAALARRQCRHNAVVLAVLVLFMLNPYLHLVSEFDFHPEALFIPAALWGLLFWEQGRLWAAGLAALLCLGLKEDIPLALAGFGLYAALFRGKKAGWGLAAAAAAAFCLIALWAIPHFAGSRVSVHHDRYASLGSSAAEMIRNIAWHPWLVPLRLLRPRVLLTLATLLGSVGFLPLAAPSALVPVLGACLHHLLSDYRGQCGLVSQYSAQTLPFLFYAALRGLAACEERLWARQGRLAAGFVLLCGAAMAFQPFYTGPFRWGDILEAARLVRQVPDQASLATDGSRGRGREDLLPHLALRRELSQLDPSPPFQEPSADYVILDPASSARFAAFLDGVGNFERLGSGDGLELWRRR